MPELAPRAPKGETPEDWEPVELPLEHEIFHMVFPLKVKPQINQDGTVRLQIEQEVSSISDATVGSDIITNKRAITTTAVVQDQQLVVLGGLMDRSLRSTDSQVPVLGSIPLVGRLFQYRGFRFR